MLQSEMITVTASGADLGETKTRFSEKDEEEKLVSDSLGHKITDLHTQLDQFQQDKRQLNEENSTLTRKVLHYYCVFTSRLGWLGSRVVSMMDSSAEGPWFKSQPRCWLVTVLGKLFTPIVPLFTKQQNW